MWSKAFYLYTSVYLFNYKWISIYLAQCLHTVGEENKEAIEVLSDPLILEQLKALMELKPVEPEHVLLKTLSAGMRKMLDIYNYWIT